MNRVVLTHCETILAYERSRATSSSSPAAAAAEPTPQPAIPDHSWQEGSYSTTLISNISTMGILDGTPLWGSAAAFHEEPRDEGAESGMDEQCRPVQTQMQSVARNHGTAGTVLGGTARTLGFLGTQKRDEHDHPLERLRSRQGHARLA